MTEGLKKVFNAIKFCENAATCEGCELAQLDEDCVDVIKRDLRGAIQEVLEENERLKRHNAFLTRFNEDVLNGNIKDGKVRLVLEVKEANERGHGC